jgi:hypothetical protein
MLEFCPCQKLSTGNFLQAISSLRIVNIEASPIMATAKKKKTTSKKVESKVTAPKKTTRKKSEQEVAASEVQSTEGFDTSKIFTRKYLYVVAVVLAAIGVLFALSKFWVIAWVDNKPVTKFALYSLLEKRDAGKTSEELIIETLVNSEAGKQRQSVSDAEVEAEIKKIEEQQGGAEQLNQILSIRGLTREDFQKLVKQQLLIQKLFGAGVNITEEDVNKYIEENKETFSPELLADPESSDAAKLREGVKEQLKWDAVNANYKKWLDENLTGSRVSRN